MDTRRICKPNAETSYSEARHGIRERVPWRVVPPLARAFVRLHWRRFLLWLVLLVGAVVQVIVVGMVYGLVDLCISLMEVWTELARKHLEITMS